MEVNDGSAQKNKVPQDEWFFRLTKRSETVLFFSKCRQRRDVVFALRGPDVEITRHKGFNTTLLIFMGIYIQKLLVIIGTALLNVRAC